MLRDDLQTARRAVKRHAAAADRAGFTAHEQALTEIVLTRAAPSASVYTYSQRDEGRVGADWLWWWHGASEWFGVLVQAKRNKPRSTRTPWYDFGYQTGSGYRQVDLLLATARRYGVPAAYVLYNHPAIGRSVPVSAACCSHPRESWRTRLQVAVLPALMAPGLIGAEDVAVQHARPLECLVCHGPTPPLLRPVASGITSERLRRFITGAEGEFPRVVARGLLTQLADRRLGQLRAAAADVVDPTTQIPDRVFVDLPEDVGHFSEPYFEHVLRGLRTQAPEYVSALQEGVLFEEIGADLEGIDGVVVWRDDPDTPDDTIVTSPE